MTTCIHTTQEVSTDVWICRSQNENSKDVKYNIRILKCKCDSESCHLKCPFMGCKSMCRHMYTCECMDYANGHICKHLHGIQSLRLRSEVHVQDDDNYDNTGKYMHAKANIIIANGIQSLQELLEKTVLWQQTQGLYFHRMLPSLIWHKVCFK